MTTKSNTSLPAGSRVQNFLKDVQESLLHLAFPHVCEGCGSDILDRDNMLCLRCLSSLPHTHFHGIANNPVEKIFWGRLSLSGATAHYYFTKESLIQRLMHAFKYRGNKAVGFYLGELMGTAMANANGFGTIEALVPLPLFKTKEKKRGYNQAEVLCKGISTIVNRPVLNDVVVRTEHTESQTKKSRIERWENMEGRFEVVNEGAIRGKHILLVDDVITTGATLEACGRALLESKNVQLSIATLCISGG